MIFVFIAVAGVISPDAPDDNIDEQLSAYDGIADEFKNTDDYQILEFENSICALDSKYDLVLNKTNEKNFTDSLDECDLNGISLSIKELNDNSSDIDSSDLKEPNYRYVESENLNFYNTPVKKLVLLILMVEKQQMKIGLIIQFILLIRMVNIIK